MIEFISQPWPWYVSGPMIALVMFLLLYLGGSFGVSSTLRTVCAIGGAGKRISFFQFDWKSQLWNVVFVLGAIIGGFIAHQFFNGGQDLQLSNAAIESLQQMNVEFNNGLAPTAIFSWQGLLTAKGIIMLVLGGFLVGFGARWAGGCTSGHAISGLANLQPASLLAVVGFFIGGLIMNWLILPLILTNI